MWGQFGPELVLDKQNQLLAGNAQGPRLPSPRDRIVYLIYYYYFQHGKRLRGNAFATGLRWEVLDAIEMPLYFLCLAEGKYLKTDCRQQD